MGQSTSGGGNRPSAKTKLKMHGVREQTGNTMKVAERFSLDARMPSWIRFQHLARYEWCRELVAGKSVVDAACGTGFGTRIIAEAGANKVQSFDLSAEAVADATRRCAGLEQVRVQIGDVTKLPISSSSVDVYVCFETNLEVFF